MRASPGPNPADTRRVQLSRSMQFAQNDQCRGSIFDTAHLAFPGGIVSEPGGCSSRPGRVTASWPAAPSRGERCNTSETKATRGHRHPAGRRPRNTQHRHAAEQHSTPPAPRGGTHRGVDLVTHRHRQQRRRQQCRTSHRIKTHSDPPAVADTVHCRTLPLTVPGRRELV